MISNDVDNHMVYPYEPDDADEYLLPDPDDAYKLELEIEAEEAARNSRTPRQRVSDDLIEYMKLPSLGRRQAD